MFMKLVARYVYKNEKEEMVVSIDCSILTTSGEYVIEVSTVKGMKLMPVERYTFKDRDEANKKFIEIKKRYCFTKVYFVKEEDR